MRKIIALCLIAFLLIPCCALAELRRGDRGEDVTELQQMLFDSGFLFELPDGVFGKDTEEAVKWFQEYAQLEQTGVAGDAEMDALRACWLELQGESDPDGQSDAPSCCQIYADADGDRHIEFCGRHAALNADESLPAREKWENELNALYEEWLAVSPENQRGAILSSRSFFLLWLEQLAQTLEAQGAEDAEMRVAELLRTECAEICAALANQ